MRPPRKAHFQRQEILAGACSRTRKCMQGRGRGAPCRNTMPVHCGSREPLATEVLDHGRAHHARTASLNTAA